jgi:hypothetical protein
MRHNLWFFFYIVELLLNRFYSVQFAKWLLDKMIQRVKYCHFKCIFHLLLQEK